MPKVGGRPARITDQTAEAVGDMVGQGLKLEHALSLQTPPIPPEHWEKTCQNSTRILRAYQRKVASRVWDMVQRIGAAERIPANLCWLLERALGYVAPRAGTATVVHNNTLVLGVSDDVLKRARAFVAGQAKTIGNTGSTDTVS